MCKRIRLVLISLLLIYSITLKATTFPFLLRCSFQTLTGTFAGDWHPFTFNQIMILIDSEAPISPILIVWFNESTVSQSKVIRKFIIFRENFKSFLSYFPLAAFILRLI